MTDFDIEKNLFTGVVEKYGDKYIEHFLEQYKIYLDMLDKVSERRQKTNEFFLALNTGLLAFLGYIDSKFTQSSDLMFVIIPFAGIIICIFWQLIIKSYDGLNTGKFAVVHAIEKRLPLALFHTEWELIGKGKDKNKYLPFTKIESKVPWVFILLYVAVLTFSIPWYTIWQSVCK